MHLGNMHRNQTRSSSSERMNNAVGLSRTGICSSTLFAFCASDLRSLCSPLKPSQFGVLGEMNSLPFTCGKADCWLRPCGISGRLTGILSTPCKWKFHLQEFVDALETYVPSSPKRSETSRSGTFCNNSRLRFPRVQRRSFFEILRVAKCYREPVHFVDIKPGRQA